MAKKHVVAAVSEIPPGGRKLVEADGRAIVVFNLAGEFFALSNRCPHRGGSLCEGTLIDATHLSLESGGRSPRNDTTDLGVVERTTIAKVLQECRGNKTRAARRLGLTRTQLHLRVRKYGLEEAATA